MSDFHRIAELKTHMRELEAKIARLYERPEEYVDADALIEGQAQSYVMALHQLCRIMAEHSKGYAVYQVFDATGDLLYIGMTSDVGERIMTHFGASWRYPGETEWAQEAAEVLVFPMPSKLVAEATEKELIRRRSPRYNRAHNGSREHPSRGIESRPSIQVMPYDVSAAAAAAVLEVLRSVGQELTSNRLLSAVRAAGHTFRDRTVREAAERLADAGHIEVRGGARGALLWCASRNVKPS